jgi:TolB protein
MRRLSGTAVVFAAIWLVSLTAGSALATAPGANGRIAFRVYFNGRHTRGAIFIVRPDGSGRRRLTHQPGSIVTTEPDWSPNGRWIVYNTWPNGDDEQSRIVKIHPNGTGRTNIDRSCSANCLSDGFPQWAPFGRRIVFQRALGPSVGTDNVIAIFAMDADGGHLRQITQVGANPSIAQPYQDTAPTWSPNGKRIAYVRVRVSDERTAIFIIRRNGTGAHRITPWRLDAGQMDWSPNGRWIAFIRGSETRRDIALVRPDGTHLHDITATGGTWGSLSFSPDGTMIVSSHRKADWDNPDIYTLRVNGRDRVDVTRTPTTYESAADWGPRRR